MGFLITWPPHKAVFLNTRPANKVSVPSSADSRASCQLLAKEWALNTGQLPAGVLPRNSVVK